MYKVFIISLLTTLFVVQNSHAKVPIVGDAAPNFSLTSVNGKKITLSGLKGKVVLMGMFHICVPCMNQAMEFNKVRKQFGEDKVVILGINTNGDTKEAVSKYLSKFPEKFSRPSNLFKNSE